MAFNCSFLSESVYIHWPFTHQHTSSVFLRAYKNALYTELEQYAQNAGQKTNLNILYFGGGALNRLSEHIVLDMSGKLREMFIFNRLLEGSIEITNDRWSIERMKQWHQLGINRVIIGIYHYTQPEPPMTELATFFSSIAVTLFIHLEAKTVVYWKKYIKNMIKLPIQKFSISFTGKKNTQRNVDFYYWFKQLINEYGFQQYELYSFALPGYASKYMQRYLKRKPNKGFGVYAESCDGYTRTINTDSISDYIKQLKWGKNAVVYSEYLTENDIRLEKIMLGLRCAKGISRGVLFSSLTYNEAVLLRERIAMLKEHNVIVEQGGRLILTPVGLGYEHEVLLQLVI